MRAAFLMTRKKWVLLSLLLLGGLAVSLTTPYNSHWETTARRHTLIKLAGMLYTYEERFNKSPTSWADLCRRLPEYSVAAKQSVFWPRWAFKYCGECPREWSPDNADDSLTGIYEFKPSEHALLMAMERPVVARAGQPRLGIAGDDFEPYEFRDGAWRRMIPFSVHPRLSGESTQMTGTASDLPAAR